MNEIWKVIKGFNNYQVSNLGRYKNKEKILKLKSTSNGYLYAHLYKGGKCIKLRIHRLVGEAFLGLDIKNKNILVCHIDDNPLNNVVDNLFLGSHQDNMDDMVKKGRSGNLGKFGKNNHLSKKIKQYTKSGEFIKEWGSMMDIERELGISHKKIGDVCHYRRKSTGGYIWECSR